MFLSVQAEGMGGAAVAYPLDAISAYHQPAVRTYLGSRLDFEGGKNLLGWGVNHPLTSWFAGGATTYLGKLEGGIAFSFLSQSVGFSIRQKGEWMGAFYGEFGWRASWGVTFQKNRLNGGVAIHPHPTLTLAGEKDRIGLEWRPACHISLRMGYSKQNYLSMGATYYWKQTQEFSFFVITKGKFGFAAGIKW